MTTVTNFNRGNIGTMRADVEAALAQVAAKHGIVIGVGRITFLANEFRCKLTAATKGANPAANGNPVATPKAFIEAAALRNNLWRINMQLADLNGTFYDPAIGANCKIIGYAATRHKYPFTIETVRGKRLKIGTELARRLAANKVA